MRYSVRLRMLLALGSTALALYTVEAGLRLNRRSAEVIIPACAGVTRPANCDAEFASGKSFDTRTKLEFMQHLERTDDTTVWSNFYPSRQLVPGADSLRKQGVTFLPLGGVSDVTTVYCNESGEFLAYRSDEHGFHNPKGLYDGRPIKLALIGDSYVQGYCVRSEQNLGSLIRQTYGRTIGLGSGANGPLIELATLIEFAAPLKPAAVVWFFYEGNDLHDLGAEKTSALILRYLERGFSRDLLTRQEEVDSSLRAVLEKRRSEEERVQRFPSAWRRLLAIRGFMRLSELRGRVRVAGGSDAVPFDAHLLRRVLATALEVCASWGGQLHFAYLPAWERYGTPGASNPHRESVLRLVNQLEIPVIDLHEAFEAHGDPLALFPYRLPNHYNPDGYRLVAETVIRHLGRSSPGFSQVDPGPSVPYIPPTDLFVATK